MIRYKIYTKGIKQINGTSIVSIMKEIEDTIQGSLNECTEQVKEITVTFNVCVFTVPEKVDSLKEDNIL